MQNPFTTTFSKTPEYTYISTHQSEDIVENFKYESLTEAVYKITGVRGSGKTVIMAKVAEEMKKRDKIEDGWIVYVLNPARDMLQQIAAYLSMESFIKSEPSSRSINLSATALGTGGGIGISSTQNTAYFDIGVEIKKMLDKVKDEGKKILLCIDEVSKTKEMIAFSLEFGSWLIEGYPVYLVCTGLYENIIELGNTKNLTFFRRGTPIETTPLSNVLMAEMYKNKLGVDITDAKTMASITKGYAYAYQQLGVLYFNKRSSETLDDIVEKLKSELYAYSYEKIWEELTPEDRNLARLIIYKDKYKREEVLELMGEKSGNYSMYRDRLLKRGIISAKQGYISIYPPFLAEYIRDYCL